VAKHTRGLSCVLEYPFGRKELFFALRKECKFTYEGLCHGWLRPCRILRFGSFCRPTLTGLTSKSFDSFAGATRRKLAQGDVLTRRLVHCTAVPKTAIAVFDVGGMRLRVVYSYTPTCVLTPANLPVA
jgi:hypothetical protein